MTDEEKVALELKVQIAETERDTLKAGSEALTTERDALKTDNARMSEALLYLEATAMVVTELKETQLPDLTRQRLTESLGKNPPVKDGKLDEETFKAKIKEVMTAETEYLSKVAGSGQIRGMGNVGDSPTTSLKDAFKTINLAEGKTEEEAERLAEIAASGR